MRNPRRVPHRSSAKPSLLKQTRLAAPPEKTGLNEEYYDVLDEKGNKTGQVLPKSVIHEQALWHGSVFIWIINSKNKVLLQYRADNKPIFPKVWDVSVAGHMSAGEGLQEAATREIKEEIGIDIKANQLKPIGQYKDVVYYPDGAPHNEHCWVFLLELDREIADLSPRLEELTELKWISLSKLEEDLSDPRESKQYAARNRYVYETVINVNKLM